MPTPFVLWAITVASLVAVTSTAVLGLRNDVPVVHVVLSETLSLSYLLAGVAAWWRRPANRLGPLMLLTGAATILSKLSWSTDPGVSTVGQLFDLVPLVMILHVFLAVPTGRLPGRLERGLVGIGYVAATVLQMAVIAIGGFGADHPLAVVDWHDAAVVLHDVELFIISAVALAGVAVLVLRRRAAGRPLRRWLALLVGAAELGFVMIAVLLVAGVLGGPAFPTVQRLSLAALALAPVAFLIGLLDARLARGSVGDLVLELQDGPQDLRGPLARALRDPSLEVAYWLPEFDTWADAAGKPVELPDSDATRASTLIERDGQPVAALVHDPALREEHELLGAVSAAAGLALENGRLRAEQEAHLEELRGSRVRVLEAEQRERRRLERDLHDGAQQRLVALSLDLGLLEHRFAADPDADPGTTTLLAQAKREVALSLEELRDVARGLHPAVLTGHGLAVALESLAARAPVPVRLTVEVDQRLDEAVEVAAYYVVCEGLANIGKHARASTATVRVVHDDPRLLVVVTDDGVGGADPGRGTGLRGLADRVEALGGTLRVDAEPGGGTRLRAELPCG